MRVLLAMLALLLACDSIQIYRVDDFLSKAHREGRRRLSRVGKHVEVSVIDSSDIRAAIEELRRIQEEFAREFDAE